FETILLRILKDFIRLPKSLNIESMDNSPSTSSLSLSSLTTLSLESYYTKQINYCTSKYNTSTRADIEWNNTKADYQEDETMEELKYSLFNCLVDLRTGYLTPFWHTDCSQIHWPEEYDTIIPGKNTYQNKPLLPTLFH
ncbi:unnamed protein product, partial [Schistosoma turkestanicum]